MFPRFQIVIVYVTSGMPLRTLWWFFGFTKCVGALMNNDTARSGFGLRRFRPRWALVRPWSQSPYSPPCTLMLAATILCTKRNQYRTQQTKQRLTKQIWNKKEKCIWNWTSFKTLNQLNIDFDKKYTFIKQATLFNFHTIKI